MRVAVVGSRSIKDAERVYAILDAAGLLCTDTVVSGEAGGIDTLAKQWAHARGVGYEGYPADWQPATGFNINAGFERNHTIVENSDIGIIIWDGVSNGTNHTRKLFAAARKPTSIHIVKPNQDEQPNLLSLFE